MHLIQCIDSITDLWTTSTDIDSMNKLIDSATAFCKNLSIGVESDFNKHHLKLLLPKRYDENRNTQVNLWNSFENILEVLEEISVSQKFDAKTRQQSLALYKKVKTFDFIVCVIFIKNVMYKLKLMTKSLEAEVLNIIDAFNPMHR